ncbi:MAG: lactate racemase domain-containing protein [Capsulimonas sp.]|uniref:lactate racemase domain-containing protein n=1 Tax=Capsulimonas sp. TaxID=2494211 RepID=UPI003265002E
MGNKELVIDDDQQNVTDGQRNEVRLAEEEVREIVARALASMDLAGKRVLLIIPDATRTAPVGLMFRTIFDLIGGETSRLDVMIALGTHPPMSEEAINHRLEITADERVGRYGGVGYLNHAWDDPAALADLGVIPADEIGKLSDGLFEMAVPVTVNRAVFDYDQLIIVGPVFPHEVAGFSGGNKYLFPGISGPEVLNFFHWLGAVITNPGIIGHKWTPVRRVIDYAASGIPTPRFAFCMVIQGHDLLGLYAGAPESAWSEAADHSARLNIVYKDRPFHTILSCAPPMYDEIWVAGKCMYKLEPVVADGGELIIYAPHIREISVTHGDLIRRIGYHTRDYFLKQWDQFKDEPWGVLAHSTHVRGIGSYEDGVERPRVRVTLATQIPEEVCRAINLGYRDPASIRIEDYQDREEEGVLYVPNAGEMLFHLKTPPEWARGGTVNQQ